MMMVAIVLIFDPRLFFLSCCSTQFLCSLLCLNNPRCILS